MSKIARRELLLRLAASAAALPFAAALPSLAFAGAGDLPASFAGSRKQRLIIMFSPNGTLPQQYWPDEPGKITKLKPILEPLEPFRNQTMLLRGVSNKIRGDG